MASFKEEVEFVINEIDNTVLNCSNSIDPLSTLTLKKRKFENEDSSTPRHKIPRICIDRFSTPRGELNKSKTL